MNYPLALTTTTMDSEYFETPMSWTWGAKTGQTQSEPVYEIDQEISTLAYRFNVLVRQWNEETLNFSSLTEILDHPAYLEVSLMGRAALPLIFLELEKTPDFWFSAITSILKSSGEDVNPVPEQHKGNLQKMTDAWLEWGRLNGHI